MTCKPLFIVKQKGIVSLIPRAEALSGPSKVDSLGTTTALDRPYGPSTSDYATFLKTTLETPGIFFRLSSSSLSVTTSWSGMK